MTTIPDPKIVREIAEDAMRGAIRDDMFWQVNQAVIEHGVPGPASKGSTFEAYRSAAIAEYNRMADALSWQDEQSQNERDDAYGRVREFADACDPDTEIIAGPPKHNAPYLSLSDLEALLNGHVVLERIAEDAVAELKRQQNKQPQDNGDVRAVTEPVERLKCWLNGRQANVYPEISTTNVVAEPRNRSTAVWTIAESDVRAVVAALEARGKKSAGEQGMCTCGESRTVCELRTEVDQLRGQLKNESAPQQPAPTVAELHARFAHPAFKYATTQGPRKSWDGYDVPPEGEGWERNVDAGRDGWERLDYHEESYWRRLRPDATCEFPSCGHPEHRRATARTEES